MIGLGNWSVSIDTMMFRGDAVLTIADKDGDYDFSVQVDKIEKMPPYTIESVTEEGDTLTIVITTPMMSGKQITASMTFEGDTLTGFAKVPLLGKIKFKNGHRV